MNDLTNYDYEFPDSYPAQVTQEMIRYYLTVLDNNTYITHHITDDVSSWENSTMQMQRDDLSGVSLEVSGDFVLVRKAKKILDDVFDQYNLHTQAKILIYQRHLVKNRYKKVAEIELDFQSYVSNDDETAINGSPYSLQDFIKSHQNQKIDIPVKEVREIKRWRYERLTLPNYGYYQIAENITGLNTGNAVSEYYRISISLSGKEIDEDSSPPLLQTQALGKDNGDLDSFFLHAELESITIYITLKITMSIWSNMPEDMGEVKVFLITQNRELGDWPYTEKREDGWYEYDINLKNRRFEIAKGEKVALVITGSKLKNIWPLYRHTYHIDKFEEFTVHFELNPQTKYFDIVKPVVLFNKLFEKLAPDTDYKAEINWEKKFEPILVAAETIRSYPNAVMHTSIKELMEFLNVLGYQHEYKDNKIIFNEIERYFNREKTTMEIAPQEMADLVTTGSEEYAYTSLEIGYERKDYNQSANGKLEVNFTCFYGTGYKSHTEKKLTLISPYRADTIGIELLNWEEPKITTETKSDNDIFCVAMQKDAIGSIYYNSYKNIEVVVFPRGKEKIEESDEIPKIKLYNAVLSPPYLAKYNESRLGIISNHLAFTATDSYREGVYTDGISLNTDIVMSKKLFNPVLYDFAIASSLEIPDEGNRTGIVKFTYKGRVRTGFISRLQWNLSKRTETTITLFMLE